jgi:hypothetical protein
MTEETETWTNPTLDCHEELLRSTLIQQHLADTRRSAPMLRFIPTSGFAFFYFIFLVFRRPDSGHDALMP